MIKVFPFLYYREDIEGCPDHPTGTPKQKVVYSGLPAATDHLLDLLGQGLILLFLRSPTTTLMVLMPLASFLLHQPNLGDPARLSLEVALVLGARVAHLGGRLLSLGATLAVSINEPLPAGMGH